jgi:heat shock protein HslJ
VLSFAWESAVRRFLIIGGILLAFATAGLSVGCAAPVHGKSLLEVHEWKVTGIDYAPYTGVPDIKLTFANGKIAGTTGINKFSGTYSTGSGNQIAIKVHLTTDATGTPDASGTQDALISAFGSATKYAAGADALTLFGSDGLTVLAGKAVVSRPLIGTTWKMAMYDDRGGNLVSALTSSAVLAAFNNKGMLQGSCGLDAYHCKYAMEGSNIKIETPQLVPLISQPDVVAQEAAYLLAVPKAATYAIQEGKLFLRDSGGKTLLVYEPE